MQRTWKDIESAYIKILASLYPEGESRELFFLAAEEVGGLRKYEFSLLKNEAVAQNIDSRLLQILDQLAMGRPIQHIFGKAPFYGQEFFVNEHTLIPRPETEELVDLIIRDWRDASSIKLIDIGTGTGCIVLSLAKHLNADSWAVDISAEAIAVAKKNAQALKTDVSFIQADILEWEFMFSERQNFDIIVSNPPYITPAEKEEMHRNVLQYEPHLALFVEESAPLLFYDHIADFALHHLAEEGTLYFEINQFLGEETADLLKKKGFSVVELFKDINGADRIIRAKRKKSLQ